MELKVAVVAIAERELLEFNLGPRHVMEALASRPHYVLLRLWNLDHALIEGLEMDLSVDMLGLMEQHTFDTYMSAESV